MSNLSGERPLVSVIIPAYNSEIYICDTIKSALEQDYRPIEILVVDDGSTDATGARIVAMMQEHPEIQFLPQTNQGCPAARNNAIEKSRGDYFAFLDHDDLWEPSKLSKQMELISQGAKAVTALSEPFWSPEIPEEQRHEIPAKRPLFHAPSAFLIEKATFFEVGAFNKSSLQSEWIEWMLRAKETKLVIAELNEVLVRRRIHLNNNSRQGASDRLNTIKQNLDRIRKARAA